MDYWEKVNETTLPVREEFYRYYRCRLHACGKSL